MREIKFRIWCKENEQFIQFNKMGFLEDGSLWYVQGVDENEEEIDPPYFENQNDWKLMQYTGLKDKNGVEIFEGDVVFDRWANAYTPVFQNGIYMAYNPKNLMQNDPSTQFNIIWKDGCEIIGNIYENNDLI